MLKLNVTCFFDNDLSQIYFDDFKNGFDGYPVLLGGRSIDYCVIFENAKIMAEPYYKKSKLVKMNKDELEGLCNYHNLFLNGFEAKNDLIDVLLDIDNERYYRDHYENECWYDLEYDFTIHGYSQGDCVKINKIGSKNWIDDCYSKDHLTNLFFDSPVSGKIELLEIEDRSSGFLEDCQENLIFEIHIDELLSNQYNYSKDQVISNFKGLNFYKLSDKLSDLENKYNLILKNVILEKLAVKLPDCPKYQW